MKRLATLLITVMSVVLTITCAFAEAAAPELVISNFVEALQKNDSEWLMKYVNLDAIKNQPRHGYTIEDLKVLFVNADVSQLEYSKSAYDEETMVINLRMNKPLSLDFELQHQNSFASKGDFYRIIGIHP